MFCQTWWNQACAFHSKTGSDNNHWWVVSPVGSRWDSKVNVQIHPLASVVCEHWNRIINRIASDAEMTCHRSVFELLPRPTSVQTIRSLLSGVGVLFPLSGSGLGSLAVTLFLLYLAADSPSDVCDDYGQKRWAVSFLFHSCVLKWQRQWNESEKFWKAASPWPPMFDDWRSHTWRSSCRSWEDSQLRCSLCPLVDLGFPLTTPHSPQLMPSQSSNLHKGRKMMKYPKFK